MVVFIFMRVRAGRHAVAGVESAERSPPETVVGDPGQPNGPAPRGHERVGQRAERLFVLPVFVVVFLPVFVVITLVFLFQFLQRPQSRAFGEPGNVNVVGVPVEGIKVPRE